MAKTAIADQVLQRQDKDGMLRRALERIIQLYTDKSHFVYELLQNAEDAGATMIKFMQYPDHLEVLHDGHPFSVENLQGLCDIGKSDKINDLNQIGEFGVGFKSVFGICENVRLYSHPIDKDRDRGYQAFAVEIRDFTHPVDIEDQEIVSGYTTKFIFPYSVGHTFSGFQTTDKLNEVLAKRLQNLGITTLLFMKNLQEIDYEINLPKLKARGSYLLSKDRINDHCSLVSAIGESSKTKEEQLSYLVFTRPVAGIQEGRTIDIAFSVSVDKEGKYEFQKSKYPYISVYFPTETESKLNFIVQGPYRTTPNRSSVPSDDKDNIALAKETAELLRDSVIELRQMGQLNFSLLKILPIDEDDFYSAPLFEAMFDTTKEMLKKEALLLCKDGTYADAEHVKISRGDKFAEVLDDKLITELIDDGNEYHWLPTFLTETSKEYKTLYGFLTDELEIEVLRPENMRNYFNENRKFLFHRDDEWLIKLYTMYESVGAAFSKQRGGSNMLTAQFIKTSKGDFVAPYRKSTGDNDNYSYYWGSYEKGSYLPNIFLPSKNAETMEDINFVDQSIYERCKHFFTEILGLQKPNEYEFFIRDFRSRYENGVQHLTDDQNISDLKKLLHYRRNADYRDDVDGLIKNYLVIRCIKDGKKVYVNPHKTKVYFSVTSDGMSIEQYYKHVDSKYYADADFYAQDDITYEDLQSLGVLDNIAVKDNVRSGEYYTGNPGRQPDWNSYDFLWKLSLDKLELVLEYIEQHPKAPDSMAKSSFIFRFLQKHVEELQGTVYIGGSVPNRPNEYSEIVTVLRRGGASYRYYGSTWGGKWLYTQSGELVSQKEISKRDLNPALYGEVQADSQLYEILGFVKNEADQMEEAAKEYDELSDEQKDKYFEIELMRRYGISTEDLDNSFGPSGDGGTGLFSGGGASSGSGYEPQQTYEFPSAQIKNWDSLRKHAAEILCYASPVKYEYVVRRIRVSKPVSEVQAYMKGMYRVSGTFEYACQMCHSVVPNVEMAQIANDPDLELDPMHLCLCPNCHTEYKKIRSDERKVEEFLYDITSLTDGEINSSDPVVIDLDGEEIWFTQTHIAEIRELLALKEAADKAEKNPESLPKTPSLVKTSAEPEEEETDEGERIVSGTDVYKEYIGKRIYHKGKRLYGIVRTCDEKYLGIEFESGPDAGKVKNFSLKVCLSNGLIKIV